VQIQSYALALVASTRCWSQLQRQAGHGRHIPRTAKASQTYSQCQRVRLILHLLRVQLAAWDVTQASTRCWPWLQTTSRSRSTCDSKPTGKPRSRQSIRLRCQQRAGAPAPRTARDLERRQPTPGWLASCSQSLALLLGQPLLDGHEATGVP
jgi:hypothetical protein